MIDLILFWSFFACSLGFMEARLDAYGGYLTERPYDKHESYMPVRVLMWFFFVYVAWEESKSGACFLGGTMIMIFPFFHNGSYFQTRHWTDYPPYNWFSNGETREDRVSFGWEIRVLAMLAGIGLYYVSVQYFV